MSRETSFFSYEYCITFSTAYLKSSLIVASSPMPSQPFCRVDAPNGTPIRLADAPAAGISRERKPGHVDRLDSLLKFPVGSCICIHHQTVICQKIVTPKYNPTKTRIAPLNFFV